jgi:Immunity protein Imm1
MDIAPRARPARIGFSHDDADRIVTTLDELDAALDELDRVARREGPRYAFISFDDDTELNLLSLGVGADRVPVSHTDERCDGSEPWDVQSCGDGAASGCTEWGYMDSWNKVANRLLVPAPQAREAARRWFENGARPDNVTWVDWTEPY